MLYYNAIIGIFTYHTIHCNVWSYVYLITHFYMNILAIWWCVMYVFIIIFKLNPQHIHKLCTINIIYKHIIYTHSGCYWQISTLIHSSNSTMYNIYYSSSSASCLSIPVCTLSVPAAGLKLVVVRVSMFCISGVKNVCMISAGLEPASLRVRIVTVGDRFYTRMSMCTDLVYIQYTRPVNVQL